MATMNNAVLKLASDICEGKCSYKNAVKQISKIDEEYGGFDMEIAYSKFPENPDENYIKEMNDSIQMGLYSKNMLLDLAKAADSLYAEKIAKNERRSKIITCAAIAIAVVAVVIIGLRMGDVI